jgi:pimeloyl-ACP methyl ester carboxylesterase
MTEERAALKAGAGARYAYLRSFDTLDAMISATLADWRERGRFFDFKGRTIFYREEGTGPVLVCIHGFPTASWDWHCVWPDLVARFRVIAPDMLGFGYSAKPRTHDYSILEQADLHEALLAERAVDAVHVLAHDYGDTVAQELLARHEERRISGKPGLAVRSICFLNGGLFPETHRARLIQKLLLGPLGPLLARLANERSFRSSFSAIFGPNTQPSHAELHDFWQLMVHDDGHRLGHRLIRYIEERRRHRERWVGALQKTRVPLRVIDGALDPVSGAHMAARYRELVSNPDVVLLETIGHYPQVEDPVAVLKAFFEFHARLGAHER